MSPNRAVVASWLPAPSPPQGPGRAKPSPVGALAFSSFPGPAPRTPMPRAGSNGAIVGLCRAASHRAGPATLLPFSRLGSDAGREGAAARHPPHSSPTRGLVYAGPGLTGVTVRGARVLSHPSEVHAAPPGWCHAHGWGQTTGDPCTEGQRQHSLGTSAACPRPRSCSCQSRGSAEAVPP